VTPAEHGMLTTLGLDDDLEGVVVVDALEAAFDAKFSDAEVATVGTVGDIFDLLRSKMDATDAGRKYPSAIAFYRVRRAWNELGIDVGRAPSADLTRLDRVYTRALVRSLAARSGLRLPPPAFTSIGKIGVAFAAGGILGCLALIVCKVAAIWLPIPIRDWSALVPIAIFFGGWIIGSALMRFDSGRLPSECRTLGALAAKSATLSYGRLAKQGGDARDRILWQALVDNLADLTKLPADQIARETCFLQSSSKRPNAAA
jgi:hypothetical protein